MDQDRASTQSATDKSPAQAAPPGVSKAPVQKVKAPVAVPRVEQEAIEPVSPVMKVVGFVRDLLLFLLSPFLGLAYLIFGPIIALFVLAWLGARSLKKDGWPE